MKERKQFIFPVFIAILLAWVVMFTLNEMQPGLSALAEQTGALLTFGKQLANVDSGSWAWNLIYSFTDFNEGPFFTDTLATVFMFAFAILSLYLEKVKSPLAGTGVSGIGNKWIWLVCSQGAGIVLANVIWRFLVGWEGWIPTFTPLVSVTPIAILVFGKPNFKKALTGAVLGAILPVALCQGLILYFQGPLGLPLFAALGIGMPLATVIGTEIFKVLPWMNKDDPEPADAAVVETIPVPAGVTAVQTSAGHLVWTRVFGGDISELYFWGSSLSGLGVFLGVIISFILNPSASAAGLGAPKMFFAFIATSAIGMLFWGPRYQKKGYAFTFEGVLMIGALLGLCTTWTITIAAMIVFAIIGPALIHWALGTKFFGRYAACVPVQFFAGVTTIVGFYILRLFA